MKEQIDCIIDEGTINNEASTLIKVEDNKIVILREGAISKELKKEEN